MSGVNKVFLVGRLGKDPEIRATQSSKVASFSIATSETYKNRAGEKVEDTEWHNIVAWREGLVGILEKYVKKGDQIHIEGKLKTRTWEKDGITRYTTEIIADRLTMLGGGNKQTAAPQQEPQHDDNSDLPF
jgi:single-strand DNA-binding protein